MDDPEARDLIGQLLALITARLEHAATLATIGQSAELAGTPKLINHIRLEIDYALPVIGAVEVIACPRKSLYHEPTSFL